MDTLDDNTPTIGRNAKPTGTLLTVMCPYNSCTHSSNFPPPACQIPSVHVASGIVLRHQDLRNGLIYGLDNPGS